MNGSDEEVIIRPGIYQHFKGGFYAVIGVAQHAGEATDYVVYRALYGDHSLFVRPKTEFVDCVLRNGEAVARFTFVRDESSMPSEVVASGR
jgi:hypothetical protein